VARDPAYWPVQSAFDRLRHLKMLRGCLSDAADPWPIGSSPTCDAHSPDGVVSLPGLLVPGQDATNREVHEALDPRRGGIMPYVYDDFSGPHCLALEGRVAASRERPPGRGGHS
jgi:hypothetical protein